MQVDEGTVRALQKAALWLAGPLAMRQTPSAEELTEVAAALTRLATQLQPVATAPSEPGIVRVREFRRALLQYPPDMMVTVRRDNGTHEPPRLQQVEVAKSENRMGLCLGYYAVDECRQRFSEPVLTVVVD